MLTGLAFVFSFYFPSISQRGLSFYYLRPASHHVILLKIKQQKKHPTQTRGPVLVKCA
jgi:hypothetical protein